MSLEIDPLSGYCNSNSTYYSKRKPVNFPQDDYLDLPTYVSSLRHNGRIALIDFATGETITFPELWQSVKSLAAGLAKLGIQKSDVVFLLLPNSIQFPIICTAILSIGAIVTTANPLNTAAEIAKQANDSAAVLAFTTPSLVDKFAATQFPIVIISSSSELASQNGRNCISTLHNLIMASNPADAPSVKIRQDDTATLLYSSGTTGTSKGVISTHRNLISVLCIFLSRLRLNREYLYLCTVPMFHVYGLSAFACGLLGSGSTIVVLSKFDVMEMLAAVEKYRVTYLPIVPPILLALTKTDIARKYDLSSLHTVICGGAPLSKESAEEFVARFPSVSLLQGYGLTETTGRGASTENEEESRHYGSVGMLTPNIEAKIVDPDSITPLPPNKKGELWLRGPIVMKGYFNNPEATASALDKDGWLRTGDLCYIDDNGYLFVVDRLKELIKYKGYQVAPAELEALLLSHPEIAEAAVIPFEDREAGQVPMAYIVRKPGSTLSETSVTDFVAQQVAPYKKVRRVAFVSEIPKTAAGKTLRKDLIKLATSKLDAFEV
jgi:OPC-8:0 CoA ligase-1